MTRKTVKKASPHIATRGVGPLEGCQSIFPKGLRIVGLDVTELQIMRRQARAQHDLIRILAHSPSVKEAGAGALSVLGQTFGWDAGALWESSGQSFSRVAFWVRPGFSGEDLRAFLARKHPRKPKSRLGRVIPLKAKNRIIGFLEFFAGGRPDLRAGALQLLEDAVCQVTQYLARTQAETALERRAFKGSLGELRRQILEVSERERRCLGEEIHDNLGQRLFGLRLSIDLLKKDLTQKNLPEKARAHDIGTQIDAAAVEVRRLSRGLLPAKVKRGELEKALRDFVAGFDVNFPGVCRFERRGGATSCSADVATHLYRLAREAVYNALKHARATAILIRLVGKADLGCLTVRDNGVGICLPVGGQSGMGLNLMQHHAILAGGALKIQQVVSGGTEIDCCFRIGEGIASAGS